VIVRVLGEGRYEVPDRALPAVEQLDEKLMAAIDSGDEADFTVALADLIREVRRSGKLLPADDLRTSTLAVPHEGSSLAEVKELLAEGS
jgi:PspA-Associated protein